MGGWDVPIGRESGGTPHLGVVQTMFTKISGAFP